MSDQPIKAKIVSVTALESEGIYGDSILLSFEYEGKTRTSEFESPLLNEENMRMWRRLVLAVVLDKKVKKDDSSIYVFDSYRAAINGKEVHIAFDGVEIYAMGRDPKNMFFPEEYSLWDQPPEVKQ
jgi:hypothetical protein